MRACPNRSGWGGAGRLLAALAAVWALGGRAALAETATAEPGPKYKAAKQVYDRLVRAIGAAKPAPHFQLLARDAPGPRMVARFHPGRGGKVLILLEEEAYDVCAEFADRAPDALAFWLGHELAHHYREQGWAGEFGAAFNDLEIGKNMRKLADQQELVAIETEADRFGGFYAHLAGFETADIAAPLLDKTYRAYGLREELGRYPTLAERQAIAQRATKQLQEKLLPAFDAGARLALLGRVLGRGYEAARCFDYVAQEFPSRETLSNAAVARVLEAIGLFRPEQLRFTYPIELDADTRLRPRAAMPSITRSAKGRSEEDDETLRARLLAEAKALLEKASAADPSYATAQVNLAAVCELLGKRELALGMAAEAREMAEKNGEPGTAASALIVRAIAHANLGDAAQAKAEFEAAAKSHPALALLNLQVLAPKAPSPAAEPRTEIEAFKKETIAGLDTRDRSAAEERPDCYITLQALDANNPEVKIVMKRATDWEALLVESFSGTAHVLATRPGYAGATARGIRIGSSLAEVQEKYGHAEHVVPARQATVHIYRRSWIAFTLGPHGRVTGWMLYRSEE